MGIQNQITQPCDLLDEKGLLNQPGYAVTPFWRYDRTKIKAGWHRIKEWDYYAVLSADRGYGITFTLADLGYIGLAAVCWLDFKGKRYHQLDTMTVLPKGKTHLPACSEHGEVRFSDKKITLGYQVHEGKRVVSATAPGFTTENEDTGLTGEIVLNQPPDMESMVIATSWEENRKAFYYNRKINCMPAEGLIRIGDREFVFRPQDSFGVLDWGRGNWTYKNRWYWGSASGLLDGHSLGWNIGYGFSDRSPASENMVFYDGKAHKLDEVRFHMNTDDYLHPWRFTSNDGRFAMDFQPILDRQSRTDLWIIKSIQHQVFGTFDGHLVLNDGTKLTIENFLGFAEDVLNWW